MNMKLVLLIIGLYVNFVGTKGEHELDGGGYMLYCPCMGRFGNQADHFLGALGND